MPSGDDGPHAFVADLASPALDDVDRHHLARVLRLRPGSGLTVSDGAGRWRVCRFGDPLEPTGEVVAVERMRPAITIGFAVVKGERPEWVVQKLTELGVDHIRPFVAARSAVRWDQRRAELNHQRFRRVVREAGMQSRQAWLPEVSPVASFRDLAATGGAVLADRSATAGPSLDRPCVLVGPEGGWDPDERSQLDRIALAPGVLRAETAALTAAALLVALRSGLVNTKRG